MGLAVVPGQVLAGVPGPVGDGAVAGAFCCVSDLSYGFVRAADGTIKKFNPKNSFGVVDIGGINGKGAITGWYLDVDEVTVHGFLRTP